MEGKVFLKHQQTVWWVCLYSSFIGRQDKKMRACLSSLLLLLLLLLLKGCIGRKQNNLRPHSHHRRNGWLLG